ncbi:MAG TPA: DUF2959 family protein, partial [Candidatus Saccharimonadales bacterium]|nr:DUF2959 family protein [Candidatus Saccharimonadales bacterium]
MKASIRCSALVSLLALALVPTSISIAADSAERAAMVKEKIQSLRQDCVQGRRQITATLEELGRLTGEGVDLRPQFEKFKAELVKMEEKAKSARNRADSMREKGAAFFSEWEQQVNTIQNEEIRNEAATRLGKRKKSYDKILAAMQDAKA